MAPYNCAPFAYDPFGCVAREAGVSEQKVGSAGDGFKERGERARLRMERSFMEQKKDLTS